MSVMKSAKSKIYKHLISKMVGAMESSEKPSEKDNDQIAPETEEEEKCDIGENNEDVGGQDDNKTNVRAMLKDYMSKKSKRHGTMMFAESKKKKEAPKGFKKV